MIGLDVAPPPLGLSAGFGYYPRAASLHSRVGAGGSGGDRI